MATNNIIVSSDDASQCQQQQQHLDWTSKQGRILTASGEALKYYSEENGFAYLPNELPHHYLENGNSRHVFREWAKNKSRAVTSEDETLNKPTPPDVFTLPNGIKATVLQSSSPIIGVWDRPLFTGKWEHSTNHDEIVYNVQTGTLFVDLRIPRSKPVSKWEKLGRKVNYNRNSRQVLESLTDEELRLYARQHVFGGYSMLTNESTSTNKGGQRPICTRHHCVDWNYIPGKPRPRPNKWHIETKSNTMDDTNNVWKEWSYSTDEYGQSYYYERWEIEGDEHGQGHTLAMRKKGIGTNNDMDGILVVVGDHFNYILGRQFTGQEKTYPNNANSLVDLVDTAVGNGDRDTAISYLTLDGGHGTISSGWNIDCSIQSWNHGRNIFERMGGSNEIQVVGSGNDLFTWEVTIGDTSWEIYECTAAKTARELEQLLKGKNGNSLSRL